MVLLFFFNDPAPTEIYTLSLHDALPILQRLALGADDDAGDVAVAGQPADPGRSEEHTSELQSQSNIVCRLLLEKKKASGRAVWGCVPRCSRPCGSSR